MPGLVVAILIAAHLIPAPNPPRVQLAGLTTTGAGAQHPISPGPTAGQLDFSNSANSGQLAPYI